MLPLEVDINLGVPKSYTSYSDLPFVPGMKIGKWQKFVCNLYNKKNYDIHIKALKQALDHGLIRKY